MSGSEQRPNNSFDSSELAQNKEHMIAPSNPTFRIAWPYWLVVAMALVLAAVVKLTWPWGLLFLLPLGLILIAFLLVPAVTVGSDGIRLYAVNRLKWDEAVAVTATRVLGLPYAVVRRRKGMRWWIPLYVDDLPGFLATLRDKAPAGSALHVFAVAESR